MSPPTLTQATTARDCASRAETKPRSRMGQVTCHQAKVKETEPQCGWSRPESGGEIMIELSLPSFRISVCCPLWFIMLPLLSSSNTLTKGSILESSLKKNIYIFSEVVFGQEMLYTGARAGVAVASPGINPLYISISCDPSITQTLGASCPKPDSSCRWDSNSSLLTGTTVALSYIWEIWWYL